MTIFNGKYLSDKEIWSRIEAIFKNRNRVRELLAQPEVSTDPVRMPELAKELHELEQTCLIIDRFINFYKEKQAFDQMLTEEGIDDDDEFQALYEAYTEEFNNMAKQIYGMLLEKGYIDEEKEDKTDLDILKFLDYAGAEYAWRLGINIGITVEEARERLDTLLEKGLIEKVQGTMLDKYHREKDWTKHMNHTYYRISRKGRLYLRELRKETEILISG